MTRGLCKSAEPASESLASSPPSLDITCSHRVSSPLRPAFEAPPHAPAGFSEGGKSLDDSPTILFSSLGFTVYFINIRSINNAVKRASLAAEIERLSPDILGLNETWLGDSVEFLEIAGYEIVSRRDRPQQSVAKLNHGGIALYRRRGGVLVTHLENSLNAERAWHIVHTDVGGVLLGLWYRPPASPHSHIESVDEELERLGDGMVGTLLVGDLNVWHKSWLRHSPADTLEGERLRTICKEHDLKQLVQDPTRGPNLLDLALSSLHGHAAAAVQPAIADHAGVLVSVELPTPVEKFTERVVWDYKFADWKGLNSALLATDFQLNLDIDAATKSFTETVLLIARRHIPTRTIQERKGSHPWLDDACRDAIAAKHAREGSDDYKDSCLQCTAVLKDRFGCYVNKVREEMNSLSKGSKKWWKLSKILMDGSHARSGIPSLRSGSGEWLHDGKSKADLFAGVFSAKFDLPEELEDDPALLDDPVQQMASFVLVRERWVKREMRNLREDQATGPDELSSRLLRNCAESLCRPVTKLLRKIIASEKWPDIWKTHRLSPLFKKGAVHKASNYRGLHLTSILSKVSERIVNIHLSKFFEATDAFGSTQWAFRKRRGCTDLVLLLICGWLRDFQARRRVGVFLSDISGAFDRVDSKKMIRKLRRAGVCEPLLGLLANYLEPRRANVAVDGALSIEMVLLDMLFQGTVLGPSLWNIYFSDIHEPAESTGCREERFADDLSTSKSFAKGTPNKDIFDDLQLCQEAVHRWGRKNRVSFDPAKEEFAILDASGGAGGSFRLLGPIVDEKLLMNDCVDKLYRKAKSKARALLRCRRFFSLPDMLLLFKSHVRSLIEWCNGAIYHASVSKLSWLDSVQGSFLRHLQLDDEQAFLKFNLAPLQLRRDIGMLGVLWKVAHGRAHPELCTLFPKCAVPRRGPRTRTDHRRHDLKLVDFCDGTQLQQFARSLFGLVRVWNLLPAQFVECSSASAFQSKLTNATKCACRDGVEGWQCMFSTGSSPFTLLIRYCFS